MKHNVYMNNDGLSITKLKMDDIVHLLKTGELTITKKELDNYLDSHQQQIIDTFPGISSSAGKTKMFFPQNNITQFIDTFSTSGIATGTEYYNCIIDNFKDDKAKKDLVPSITIDTIFKNRRKLDEKHERVEYFTMDLDLKNLPKSIIDDNYGTSGDAYQQLSNKVFDCVEANKIDSLKLMFISGSEKGVKMVFNSKVNNFKKEFIMCSELIDKAVGFELSKYPNVYDENASCVITTPMNIHKSARVYYNKYATPLLAYKKEQFKEIKNLDKTFSGMEKKYLSGYPTDEYKSGLHMQLFAFAIAAKKRGFPNEFIKDQILSKWGDTPDHNSGKSMKNDIENNILKHALSGIMSNTISYEIVKDELTNEDMLVEKLYSFDEKAMKWKIDEIVFEDLLIEKLFRLDESDELYRLDGNIVIKSSNLDADKKSLFFESLEKIISEITQKDSSLAIRDRKEIVRNCKDLVVFNYLNTITTPRLNSREFIECDTKYEIFLYTKNAKIRITANNIEEKDYAKDDAILETQLVKNHKNEFVEYNSLAKWEDYKSLPFYKKIAGDNDPKEFDYLCSIIGYLISTERSSGKNYNVLFIDGSGDKEGGGSGKSVIMKNFDYIRNTLKLQTPTWGEYTWGAWDNHNIIYLEDIIWKDFSIRKLRNFYDLGMDIRKMRTVSKHISGNAVPRLCMTTNYAPDSNDKADRERLIVFEPYTFFDRKENKANEWLGKIHGEDPITIMEYESVGEWSYWLSFMIHCCQVYLKNGVNEDLKKQYSKSITKKRDKEMEDTPEYFILQNKAEEIINRFSQVTGSCYVFSNELNDLFQQKKSRYQRVQDFHRGMFTRLLEEGGLETEFKSKIFDNKGGFKITKK